jgi:hypothetical protein
MDYFKKLMYAREISNKRLTQLEEENFIDSLLQNEYSKCPNTIMELIFNARKINRIHSKKLYSSSFFDYSEIIEKNLKLVDTYHSNMILYKDNLCENIPKIIKKINNIDNNTY